MHKTASIAHAGHGCKYLILHPTYAIHTLATEKHNQYTLARPQP